MVSVDTQRVATFIWAGHHLWASPVVLTVGIASLFYVLGPAALAGLGVIGLLIPANILSTYMISKLQRRLMQHKDERVKHLTEALHVRVVINFSFYLKKFII